jgi:hypothetical protein
VVVVVVVAAAVVVVVVVVLVLCCINQSLILFDARRSLGMPTLLSDMKFFSWRCS